MAIPFNQVSALAGSTLLSLPSERLEPAIAELDAACLRDGVLQPMPAAFYASRDRIELSAWALTRGLYCLPTVELIDWLRAQIEGESAIEIGAGHGAIGRALGIPITDSLQQADPDVIEAYRQMGQSVMQYPPDIEKLSALAAVEKYRPSVVIAAWVTWRYDPLRHSQGGNQRGVDERKLLGKPSVGRYIQIEHTRAHAKRPLLARPHVTHELPFLWSRSVDGTNVVRVWSNWR